MSPEPQSRAKGILYICEHQHLGDEVLQFHSMRANSCYNTSSIQRALSRNQSVPATAAGLAVWPELA